MIPDTASRAGSHQAGALCGLFGTGWRKLPRACLATPPCALQPQRRAPRGRIAEGSAAAPEQPHSLHLKPAAAARRLWPDATARSCVDEGRGAKGEHGAAPRLPPAPPLPSAAAAPSVPPAVAPSPRARPTRLLAAASRPLRLLAATPPPPALDLPDAPRQRQRGPRPLSPAPRDASAVTPQGGANSTGAGAASELAVSEFASELLVAPASSLFFRALLKTPPMWRWRPSQGRSRRGPSDAAPAYEGKRSKGLGEAN